MKVVVAHNRYQLRGGEDSVVESEVRMLRNRGIEVTEYIRSNDEIKYIGKLKAARNAIWSNETASEFSKVLSEVRPDVVHIHNTFSVISPSLLLACSIANVPVIQTIHNFRLLCPQAMLLRNGKICEECIGGFPWRGVVRGCYRGSSAQTFLNATSTLVGTVIERRGHGVRRYIALNEFCKNKLIQGGVAREKIIIKPNFVEDPGVRSESRRGLLFAGRLSEEKGVNVLAEAVRACNGIDVRVIGDGPERAVLQDCGGVELLGSMDSSRVVHWMSRSVALLLPSIWYENFPRVLVEAFASGTPVIGSRIGALADLIEDGTTGLLFDPNSHEDLAKKMRWAATNPNEMIRMGRRARREYVEKYSEERNFELLHAIYKDVMESRA